MTSSPLPRLNLKLVPNTGFCIAAALKSGYARSYLLGKGSKFLSYRLYSSDAILLEGQDKLKTKFGFDRAQTVRAILESAK